MAQPASPPVQSTPSAASDVWSVVPSILWVGLALAAIVLFRREIRDTLRNLSWRLRTGAALKLFSLELGQTYVAQSVETDKMEAALPHRKDINEERWIEREQYYKPNRNIHLVHKLAPSARPKMLYDIQIYLVPHRDATLACVSKVEYYFGHHWGSQVFTSIDRARGFSVSTSAFGPFMCTCKLFFTDGESVMLNRYIDFEMGAIGTKA